MRLIALVPIRHYSERVKGKNYKLFNGLPLFHWILKTLDQVQLVDKVLINTDSPIIINEAATLSEKIVIKIRKKELCDDKTSMNEIISHDINEHEADVYLQTHTTNPLLKPDTISRAITKLMSNNSSYDSLFSVTQTQIRLWTDDLQPINHNPNELIRTQDLPKVYEENSNIYLFSRKSFSKSGNRIGEAPYMFTMDRIESCDIDDINDFKIAETFHKIGYNNG